MNLYSMQPPKLMLRLMRITFAVTALLAMPCFAQTPTVLSAPDAPLVFELPAAPSLTRQLTTTTTAKLATPAQHLERGLAYPLWLSDANFTVKGRAGQRQSVVVEAKRGNPDLTTDLLLTLNNKGVRSLEASTLIFDKIHAFAAAALMPPANLAIHPVRAGVFAVLPNTTAPIQFPDAPPKPLATSQAAPPSHSDAHARPDAVSNAGSNASPYVSQNVNPTPPKRMVVATSQQNAKGSAKAQPVTLPTISASQAIPDKASQTAIPEIQATPSLTVRPSNVPAAKLKPLPEPGWLDDWPLIAGAVTGLLLLAYLVTRLLKKRSKPQAFENTRSQSEQVANTVFGLSDEEAEAMHKKWLSDQLLSKNNK